MLSSVFWRNVHAAHTYIQANYSRICEFTTSLGQIARLYLNDDEWMGIQMKCKDLPLCVFPEKEVE